MRSEHRSHALEVAPLVAAAFLASILVLPSLAAAQPAPGSPADWEALKKRITGPSTPALDPREDEESLLGPQGLEDGTTRGVREDTGSEPGSDDPTVVPLGLRDDETEAIAVDRTGGSGSREDRDRARRETEGSETPETERFRGPGQGERTDVTERLLDSHLDAESVERVRKGDIDEELILRLQDEGASRDIIEDLRKRVNESPEPSEPTPTTIAPLPE